MKILKQLFSGWLMGMLLMVFAFSIAYATFIENDHGAAAARIVVYGASWFEVLLLLMVINFSGMIFTKRLYARSKLNILAIHLALIIIVIGAGVTRYFGLEGQMSIREGETSNVYKSADTYFQVEIKNGEWKRNESNKVLIARVNKELFSKNYKTPESKIKVSITDYFPSAMEVPVASESEDAHAYVTIVLGGSSGRYQFYMKEGDQKIFPDFGFAFGDSTRTDLIQVIKREDQLFIRYPQDSMSTDDGYRFKSIEVMSMQAVNDIPFVITDFVKKGKIDYVPLKEPSNNGSPIAKVLVNEQELYLPYGKEKTVEVDNNQVTMSLGFRSFQLPFSLRLNKFNLTRYPGSNSPSSFASDVTVFDHENNEEFPYNIYMNNILNYKGYRLFQSSYDQDEKGTILSVNHDYWGTLITYIGYFLLFASLIISFFTKTRFSRITQQLKEVHEKRKKIGNAGVIIFAILFGGSLLTGNSLKAQSAISFKDHAKSFSELCVQNKNGRIEPINTMAGKILVKISKKNTYNGQSASEVFLGMISDQEAWKQEYIFKVREASVRELLGIDRDYASFNEFLDENGTYILSRYVEKAYNTKPVLRSKHDKALINVDERINVFFMVLNGSMLRIFPIEDDLNDKWNTPREHHKRLGHNTVEGDLFESYLGKLKEASTSGDYQEASLSLVEIVKYQSKYGTKIIPSTTRLKLEIFYNETNIFKTLFPFYLCLGILLIGLFFIQTFKPTLEFKTITRISLVVLIVAFMAQTAGLVIRWYISGHAPWSNGYESMIYISWATMLAGFVFMKRSSVSLGVTATLSGITLLTAHMSWLNPELTNLVPVLKSHWLTIHVATITASYGFLGLGCMVAFLNLCMMIFRNKNNYKRINLTLKELNIIVEMALSVGLVLLIIGNFLGGIWANESWGRYWGWDPKETWTLVTIILYTFTLHLTLIPSLRSTFTFSFMAFISFSAVLMTYFGVNYYLTGLHSYAGGDTPEIPMMVYYTLIFVTLVSAMAARNEAVYEKMKKQ